MGAVGKGSSSSETYYDFKDNPILSTDETGTGNDAADWWREHSDFSNAKEWEEDLLKTAEKDAIGRWTGIGYHDVEDLYNTPWDELDDWQREMAANLYEGINKFELKKGITVNRATDFKIFGSNTSMTTEQIIDYLNNNTDNGLIQSDGFMSFSTITDGVSVAGSGLVIHLDVPPNKGGGAYISNSVGGNYAEKEYLTNSNSILQFDPKSVRKDGYRVHINAKLVGRVEMQTVDPKNNSKFAKKK